MHLCTHDLLRLHIHTHLHTHTHTHTHTHLHACMHTHLHTQSGTHACMQTHTCTLCVCMPKHANVYTSILRGVPLLCYTYIYFFSVSGTEEETEMAANCLWLVTNSKPCPNCKSPIQKNEGCNHMKCSKVRENVPLFFFFWGGRYHAFVCIGTNTLENTW